MSEAFAPLGGEQFLRLTTFRRNGEAVATPVWFAEVGDRLGVFTAADAGKVKRIRRESRVLVAPCSFRGRPKGEDREASARLVLGEEAALIQAALDAKYGWLFRFFTRRRPDHAFIEIAAAD